MMAWDIKVLDGGFSTQLFRYVGIVDGDPLWTSRFVSTRPNDVVKAHVDFLRAGADIIETCTYQSSVEGYMQHLNCSREFALGLIRKAGQLALKAKDIYIKENPSVDPQVVGSIGPYGAFLHDGSEYSGDYINRVTPEMIKEKHRDRINELMKDGINTFAFETIPSRKEALIVIELLKEYPDIKCWISFSCSDVAHIASGDDFKSTAIECYKLNPKQIVAVGVNCVNPTYVSELFKDINKGREENDKIPLVVYPNSGEKYVIELGWTDPPGFIEPLHRYVDEWVSLGARYIGGCCRTHPDDIAFIKQEVAKWRGFT
ncbi:betaine-homocysteine S-methyltransferase-like [Arctopsyche grandis]|uniref:betaine-homocysteine S-methyltransferase-like n=1 Tax=Arctopsyche grandis TaxID=121162 RepID=UPI00406DA409